jgi:hypothetical protein
MTSGNTNLKPVLAYYYYGHELIIIALFQYLAKSISISVQYVALH